MGTHARRATFVLALLLLPVLLPGQTIPSEQPAALTYLDRYREIKRLGSSAGRAADVDHLVLTREAGRLTLERGTLLLLAPVGGRTVGAIFQGQGQFAFAPPLGPERAELRRFAGIENLNDPFSEAILLFEDSTTEQLSGLAFTAAVAPPLVLDHVRELLRSLEGDNEGSLRSDIVAPFLNGHATGFFLARLERAQGGPVLFEINPDQAEAVQLYKPVSHRRWGANWAVVTQFPTDRLRPGTTGAWFERQRLRVPVYVMDVRLTPTSSANLDFAGEGTLALRADEPVGPWLRFALHRKLVVDSARWGTGVAAAVFKAKDSGDLWVRGERRLEAGDSASLRLFYHDEGGRVIDRYGDWFFIDPGAAWYPRNGQGNNLAMFDVTFHAPSWYPLASIGDRTDSAVTEKVRTTRWITRRPVRSTTFNLGLFENYHTQLPGAPPLDVLLSERAHSELARVLLAQGYMIPQQSHMQENVSADVTNSLKLFSHLFGQCLDSHFYVTEIPYSEGVSFPGLIDLSLSTFHYTSFDGFDEFFRAHEVAHQWWGNGIAPGSYRDLWLSEGLAEFSALWYLQSERKHNNEYFRFLDQYKADIDLEKDNVGPIWLGYRASNENVSSNIMVYEKSAWVFHMLRTMMLDLRTMKEDRFTDMLRDYYATYRGGSATTADFQRVVEEHVGVPMDWFFDEWVKGTAIPSYRVAWKGQAMDGGKYAARLRVKQEHVPPDFRMPVLVSVDLGQNRFANFRVDVRGDQTDYVSPLLPAQPKDVTFNGLHSVLADVKMEAW